jgi:hypothetical protein
MTDETEGGEVSVEEAAQPQLPKVGVIVRGCGNADLLRGSLDSVLGQVCDADIVVVVVCDGDAESFNVARYFLKSANAEAVHGRLLRRRYGATKSLNVGLDLCRDCDLIAVLEPGSVWSVGHVAAALNVRVDGPAIYAPSTYNTVDKAGAVVSKKRSTGPVSSYLFDVGLPPSVFFDGGDACLNVFALRLAASGVELIETGERTFGTIEVDDFDPWSGEGAPPKATRPNEPDIVDAF